MYKKEAINKVKEYSILLKKYIPFEFFNQVVVLLSFVSPVFSISPMACFKATAFDVGVK